MDPIRTYLANGTLPADPKEADPVKHRSNWFILYEGILYKRSFAQPLLPQRYEGRYLNNYTKGYAVRT